MNEVLYNLAAATKKEEYLELGHRFAQPSFFDPLAEHRDELKGLHENTHVPKVIGAARRYELTGERRYRDIAILAQDRARFMDDPVAVTGERRARAALRFGDLASQRFGGIFCIGRAGRKDHLVST